MNSDKQRAAIAEYCGWNGIKIYFDSNKWWGRNPKSKDLDLVPDYLNDLNAMHEAEKMLKGNTQWYKYEETLEAIIRADTAHWPIHATAAYRAEAFLRTIEKWEE